MPEINTQTQSVDHGTSTNYASYSSGMDAIAMINEILIQMQELNEELRDMMQEYSQQQQILGWEIQIAGLEMKKQGIDDAFDAASKGAWASIGSGIAGTLGSVVGAAGALSSPVLHQVAQATQTGLQATGKLSEGIIGLKLAEDTQSADKEKAVADLIAANAQQYTKGVSELRDLISTVRQQLQSLTKDLVDLKAKMDNSVNIR